jgi:DNA invertase Pin-like site-specific DNA recombinase
MARKAKTETTQTQTIVYARISTNGQDSTRQIADCTRYAQTVSRAVTRTIEEAISSRKTDREIFGIIAGLRAGDALIVSELSRLGRSMIELSGMIADIIKAGASLHVASDNRVIDSSIESQCYVFAFSLAAQVERDLISERTTSALRARKAAGVRLGRPEGTRKAAAIIAEKKIDTKTLDTMVAAGASMASIGRVLGVDARTVKRYLAEKK